ncbi:hypothetical protein BHM03_00039957 [Ensete ventricosum]|nr:hypothetical protein BHM03_00039957 [Ensete ventricosum]
MADLAAWSINSSKEHSYNCFTREGCSAPLTYSTMTSPLVHTRVELVRFGHHAFKGSSTLARGSFNICVAKHRSFPALSSTSHNSRRVKGQLEGSIASVDSFPYRDKSSRSFLQRQSSAALRPSPCSSSLVAPLPPCRGASQPPDGALHDRLDVDIGSRRWCRSARGATNRFLHPCQVKHICKARKEVNLPNSHKAKKTAKRDIPRGAGLSPTLTNHVSVIPFMAQEDERIT